MGWLTDIINGIGDAISSAFQSLWEVISDTIFGIFFEWLYETIFDAIADFFTRMGKMGTDLFDLPWVEACIKLFSLFGWALFIAGLVVAIFDIAIEYQSMRQFNIKRQVLPLIYGFLAVNLFTVLPVRLYTFCISIQNTLMHDLSSLFASHTAHSLDHAASLALKKMTGTVNLFSQLAIIALGYCVIKIFFANIKRGGILLTQIAVGSLYMFSIPKGYTDGFIQWCKQVIALCVTAFMQMTLLYLGLLTWQTNILLGLGVMLSANEVPRVAQMFGLDTSVRVNMMSAVHTTTTAINLSRALAKK